LWEKFSLKWERRIRSLSPVMGKTKFEENGIEMRNLELLKSKGILEGRKPN